MGGWLRTAFTATFTFFKGFNVLGWCFVYAVVVGGFFFAVSRNALLAVFIGLVLAFPLFYILNVWKEQRAYRTRELNAISKYIQVLVFNLKTGKNILNAYEATLPLVDTILHVDIERTIEALKYRGVLDVSHFDKYNFKILELFHNNLKIKATKGGIATDIFKNTTKDLTRVLSKRDELSRMKSYIVGETYMMMAMAMSVPLILSFTAEGIYIPFAQSAIGLPFLVVYLIVIYGLIYGVNKRLLDTEVA